MMLRALTLADLEAWAGLLAAAFGREQAAMRAVVQWMAEGPGLLAWGAWDGARLAAQYSCARIGLTGPDGGAYAAGLSVNLAVHPDYRGQGLVKRVAQPVYAQLAAEGAVAGVGFSNAEGVQVDRRSQSYGYRVVGRLQPVIAGLGRTLAVEPLALGETWPGAEERWAEVVPHDAHWRLGWTPERLAQRFARHPFRRYRYGVWREAGMVQGVVVYRLLGRGPLAGAALLAAYGVDVRALIARWATALRAEGRWYVHGLVAPGGVLAEALRAAGCVVALPSRTPYYLTVRPLGDAPASLCSFAQWECQGGDVL